MKKYLPVVLLSVVCLGLAGCSSSGGGSGSTNTQVTEYQAADSLAQTACEMSDLLKEGLTIADLVPAVNSVQPNSGETWSYNPVTGYWHQTGSLVGQYMSVNADYYYGLWDEINPLLPTASPDVLTKVTYYGEASLEMSSAEGDSLSMSFTMGSSIAPLTYTGYNTGDNITFSGNVTVTMRSTVQNTTTDLTISYSANALTLDYSGLNEYPTGTFSFIISSGSENLLYSGTITYNGTSTGTISINGNVYAFDLDLGELIS